MYIFFKLPLRPKKITSQDHLFSYLFLCFLNTVSAPVTFNIFFKNYPVYILFGVFQIVNICRREYWQPYELTKNGSEILKNSTFDPSRPTKVLCHGFMNSYMNDMEQEILDGK